MSKLLASIYKEFLVMINDKVGLLLMFFMPVVLVFIITLVQDSAFNLVNNNTLKLIVVNNDKGDLGDSLINVLESSGNFEIKIKKNVINDIEGILLSGEELIAINIPSEFTKTLKANAKNTSTIMLSEFGAIDDITLSKDAKALNLELIYDPILTENFTYAIGSIVQSFVTVIENKMIIESLYAETGFEEMPERIEKEFIKNRTSISFISANISDAEITPNSTQHNVPAWTIFAMFFMVVSLGGNIVKERLSGSFIRLQTIPASFLLVLISKVIIYLGVACIQIGVIFFIGRFIFPMIGLYPLIMPSNIIGFILVSILSALAAISFAMTVGTYAKTQEQANGFGAITVIIFAAIGGIWVPSFILPDYLQTIGNLSPLKWCIEGYYALFLKGGDWIYLYPSIIYLIIFILACKIFIYIKLKFQNYI